MYGGAEAKEAKTLLSHCRGEERLKMSGLRNSYGSEEEERPIGSFLLSFRNRESELELVEC